MKKISPISMWRNQKQLYELYGQQCVACKKIFYPKKYVCSCGTNSFGTNSFGTNSFEKIKLSGRGKLLTFTQVYKSPENFKFMTPYILGIIELEEGVKIISQITGTGMQDLYPGMPVRAVFRKLFADGDKGVISYGLKFQIST
jgi:hypothetical protein